MIKFNFSKVNNSISSVEMFGHANSQKNIDQEYDLICAGASAIIFGILNKLAIEKFSGDLKILDNLILINVKENDLNNEKFQIILETLIIQLKTLEESYPKNIKIREVKHA